MNWKKIQTLSIFYALFVCSFSWLNATENVKIDAIKATYKETFASQRSKNPRDELSDVLLKTLKNYDTQKKILIDLETFTQNGKDKKIISALNTDLLESLNRNINEGKIFLHQANEYCNYMYEQIKQMQIPDEEKLRLECRVDELKTAANKFALQITYSAKKDQTEDCRVLEINDDLGVILLPKGYLNGIRVGRSFTIPEANDAEITVIAVRQFISAAIVIKGELKDIAPGMPVEGAR